MVGLKWNTGKLYYSTVELGYQLPTTLRIECRSLGKTESENDEVCQTGGEK